MNIHQLEQKMKQELKDLGVSDFGHGGNYTDGDKITQGQHTTVEVPFKNRTFVASEVKRIVEKYYRAVTSVHIPKNGCIHGASSDSTTYYEIILNHEEVK